MQQVSYDTMEFSAKLKKLMRDHRYSQEMLARQLDVSQNLVSLWSRGKSTPDLKQASALARALGVSLDYLADDDLDDQPLPSSLTEDEKMVLRIFHTSGLTAEEAVERLLIRKLGLQARR